MSLGPVTGNRHAGAHKAEPKSNLRQRLNDQVQRRTQQGTFKTGADGRTTFVPKLVEDASAHVVTTAPHSALTHNQQVLAKMRTIKTEPAEGDDEREAMGLSSCDKAARRNGALLRLATDGLPLQESYAVLGMTQAELAQVVAAPTFNPMTEQLSVCDYVEVVCEGADEQGKRGHIYSINGGARYVAYDDGTCDAGGGWVLRDSLKLIAKAKA